MTTNWLTTTTDLNDGRINRTINFNVVEFIDSSDLYLPISNITSAFGILVPEFV
jgi:hypothetical protein